ncbi:hypothetical protein VTI74DRAFT_6400 [Chaetomium olivicolor]
MDGVGRVGLCDNYLYASSIRPSPAHLRFGCMSRHLSPTQAFAWQAAIGDTTAGGGASSNRHFGGKPRTGDCRRPVIQDPVCSVCRAGVVKGKKGMGAADRFGQRSWLAGWLGLEHHPRSLLLLCKDVSKQTWAGVTPTEPASPSPLSLNATTLPSRHPQLQRAAVPAVIDLSLLLQPSPPFGRAHFLSDSSLPFQDSPDCPKPAHNKNK